MNTEEQKQAIEQMIEKLGELIPLSQQLQIYQQNILALKLYEFENYLRICLENDFEIIDEPVTDEELNPEQVMLSRCIEA